MADPELVKILRQGSEVWNRWREHQPENLQIDLSGANLDGENLNNIHLYRTDLSNASLEGADLRSADLSRANLRNAHLSDTDLRGADLHSANLSGADLSLYQNDEALNDHVLNDAYWIGADLRGANLSEADLSGANLRVTLLDRAYLRGANLSGAYLRAATLYDTNLRNALLRNAHMSAARLIGVDLRGADLRGADLSGVHLSGATIADLDLRQTRGLLSIHHFGPSSIELWTVRLPRDGSALHFLRGAGVSDEWIDDYRARRMNPTHYHSCFISYSSKDERIARRLHADLQAQGVRCWFAPHEMKIGDKIHQRIEEAIHVQEKLLLILSKYSIASARVEDEVEAALEKERRQQREVLFPIRLDNAVMKTDQAWAAKLRRQRHIGDFTDWTNPQTYQKAFERLLRDLKKADSQPA